MIFSLIAVEESYNKELIQRVTTFTDGLVVGARE